MERFNRMKYMLKHPEEFSKSDITRVKKTIAQAEREAHLHPRLRIKPRGFITGLLEGN